MDTVDWFCAATFTLSVATFSVARRWTTRLDGGDIHVRRSAMNAQEPRHMPNILEDAAIIVGVATILVAQVHGFDWNESLARAVQRAAEPWGMR